MMLRFKIVSVIQPEIVLTIENTTSRLNLPFCICITIIFRKNLQEILCKDLFFPKYNYVPIFIQDLIKTVFCHHG